MQNIVVTTSAQSFQSVEMLVFSPTGALMHMDFFAINWRNNVIDPASLGAMQIYSDVQNQQNAPGVNTWYTLPVLGPTLVLRIRSTSTENVSVRILGTNRAIPFAKVGVNAATDGLANSMTLPLGGEVQNANIAQIGGVKVVSPISPGGTLPVREAAATIAGNFAVAGSASSVSLVGAEPLRRGLVMTNDSTARCYVLMNSGVAATNNYSFFMNPGDRYEMWPIVTTQFTGIWTAAAGFMFVTELK
jgi:hypothetical protein